MSRPKPNILMEYINTKNYKVEQILEAEAIYAVFYKGAPINLRIISQLISVPGPKYRKCAFSNKGHCFNLAERLNKLFKTTEFVAYELKIGTPITEDI